MSEVSLYDAIVVGTGMGAGAAGYELAKFGLKVLFLERGLGPESWNPQYSQDYAERYLREDRSNQDIVYSQSARSTYKVDSWVPLIGGGLGGSTAVYGAGHLRFHPKDFESWPFSYDELRPYYDECDRLFGVRGTQDPLDRNQRPLLPPEELSGALRELFTFLEDKGYHPFRGGVAYKAIKGCQKCFGHFCSKDCKNTAGNTFILPAIEKMNAHISYDTKVLGIELSSDDKVIINAVSKGNEKKTFYGRTVFIGAGALITPTIIRTLPQAKKLPVGKYLMRHLVDFYSVQMKSSDGIGSKLMEVACTDFYSEKYNWGILNALGSLMSPEVMAKEFSDRVVNQNRLLPVTIGKLIYPFVKYYLERARDKKVIITAIMEDRANIQNEVLANSTIDNVYIKYCISKEDRRRLSEFRKHLKELFKPLDASLLKVAEDNSFLSHACGTCRMGQNPEDSVVDAYGKMHGTNNIFIVDASIFPSSGAANPSSTIAAMGMRVANEFVKQLRST